MTVKNFHVDKDDRSELEALLSELAQYRLPTTTKLTMKQKQRLVDTANYVFVCRSATIKIFLRELQQLLKRGGLYFEIWDKLPLNEKEEKNYADPHYKNKPHIIVLFV